MVWGKERGLTKRLEIEPSGVLTKLLFHWIRNFASCQDFCAMSNHFEDISDEQLLEAVNSIENGTENNYSQQVNLICCNKKIF